MPVNSYNVLQAYLKALGIPPGSRGGLTGSQQWKSMFSDLTKGAPGGLNAKQTADYIMNNFDSVNSLTERATNGEAIQQEAFDTILSSRPVEGPGDDGEGPGDGGERKTEPPNSPSDWEDILKTVGLSTAFSSAFNDFYGSAVTQSTLKSFLRAFATPEEALASVLKVAETGLSVEPLILGLTELQGSSIGARAGGVLGSGDISGVGAFVRDQLGSALPERKSPLTDSDIFATPPRAQVQPLDPVDVNDSFIARQSAQLNAQEMDRIFDAIKFSPQKTERDLLKMIEDAAPVLTEESWVFFQNFLEISLNIFFNPDGVYGKTQR